MDDVMVYCKNCKRKVAAGNYVLHSVHCERNIELCVYCSDPIPHREMQKHLEDTHAMDVCSSCSMPMEKWMLEKHKDTCPKQPVKCEFCNLEIYTDCLEEHIAACGAHTEKCSVCNLYVLLQDMKIHQTICKKDNCPKQSVICEFCNLEISIHCLEEHIVACGARTEKCSVCNHYIMLQDMKIHQKICKKDAPSPKIGFCMYCQEEFPPDFLHTHISICKLKVKKCPNCGEMVKQCMDNHICQKEVNTMNIVRCISCDKKYPSNLLAVHIADCRARNKRAKFSLNTEKCQYCDLVVSSDIFQEHIDWCGSVPIECKICDEMLLRRNKKQHSCQQGLSKGICTFCKKEIPYVDLIVHMNTCGRNLDTHRSSIDAASKDNAQNQANLLNSSISKHFADLTFGNKSFKDPSSHKPFQECKLCGEKMPSLIYTAHIETCPKRQHECKLCLKTVPFSRRKPGDHDCRLFTDRDTLDRKPEKYRSIYREKCLESQNQCALCLETIPLSKKYRHISECKILNSEENDFPRVNLKDTFGPEKSFSAIAASNKSPSMDYLEKNPQLCTICGNKIPTERFYNHVQYCSARKKMCHFCKESISIEEEELHMRQCVEYKERKCSEDILEPEKSYAAIGASDKYPSKDCSENTSELCTLCGNSFPMERFKDHVTYCKARMKMCHICKENIFIDDEKRHLKQCLENKGKLNGKGKKNKKNQGILRRFFPSKQDSNKYSMTSNAVPANEFEFDGIPCEFCNEIFPFIQIIEHQSGCRPDLACCTVPKASGYTSPNASGAKQCYVEQDSSIIDFKGSSDIRDRRNRHNFDSIQDNFHRKTYPSNKLPAVDSKRDPADDRKMHEEKQNSNKVLFKYSSRRDKKEFSDPITEGKSIDLQESVKSKIMPGEFLESNYTQIQARSFANFEETSTTKDFENGTNLKLLYSERNSKVKDVMNSTSDHELKAIGAERGQRKEVFQRNKDTEYSYSTTYDEKKNTEHYSQNVWSGVEERTQSFNSDNTTGSSDDIYLSCGEELDDVQPFMTTSEAIPVDKKHEKPSEYVVLPVEKEDSKNNETFDYNRQKTLNNNIFSFNINKFEDVHDSEQDVDKKNKETFGSDCEADLDHNRFKFDCNQTHNSENNASDISECTLNSMDYMKDILKFEDFVLVDDDGKKDNDLDAYFQFLESDDTVPNSANGFSKRIASDKKPCKCHNSVCYCAFNQQSALPPDNTLAMVEVNDLIAKGARSKETCNYDSSLSDSMVVERESKSNLCASSDPMEFDWKLESESSASSNKPIEVLEWRMLEAHENVLIASKEEKENSDNWRKVNIS